MQKQDWYALLAFAVISVMLFLPALLSPDAFPAGYDLVRQRSYFFTVIHTTFAQTGELPLWDPYTFAGSPYIASPHQQFFSPLHALVLFFSPDMLFFPFLTLFVFLAGMGTYALARRWMSPFPGFIAAVCYMLSGTVLAKVYAGVFSYFQLICLLPLLFFAAQLVLERPNLRHALYLALVWALLLTINNMQLFLYGSVAVGIFLLIQLAYARWQHASAVIAKILFAGCLAMLLSAVVLLPLLEGMPYGTISRETDLAFQTEGSFPPSALLRFALPWVFGATAEENYGALPWATLYNYIGIIPLFLICVSLVYARNRVTKSLLWLGGFAFLFALGGYTPLYRIFLLFPGFSLFRFPSKMIVVFVLALSLLAGFGTATLLTQKFPTVHQLRWRKLLWGCFIFSFLATLGIVFAKATILNKGVALLVARYTLAQRSLPLEHYLPVVELVYSHIRLNFILLTSLLGFSAILLTRQLRNPWRYFPHALAFVLLVDLLFFSMPLIESAPRSVFFGNNPVAEFLAQQPGTFRVLDTARALPQDIAVRYGISMLDGYTTNHLQHYTDLTTLVGNFSPRIVPRPQIIGLDLDQVVNQPILDMLNVRYVVTAKPVTNPTYHLVFQQSMRIRDLDRDGIVYIYENTHVLPRAFVVPKGIEVHDVRSALSAFDPREEVLLESPVGASGSGALQEAEIRSYTPNQVIVMAQRDSPGYLVLGDMWYPGWQAMDNGNAVPVLKANGGIRAVWLSAGSHTVTFTFSPRSYIIGKWISFAALVLLIVLWFSFGTKAKSKLR